MATLCAESSDFLRSYVSEKETIEGRRDDLYLIGSIGLNGSSEPLRGFEFMATLLGGNNNINRNWL